MLSLRRKSLSKGFKTTGMLDYQDTFFWGNVPKTTQKLILQNYRNIQEPSTRENKFKQNMYDILREKHLSRNFSFPPSFQNILQQN